MNYRRDLDGLRAIAVLAVFFYHADLSYHGFDLFKGGLFGVDVFFVLSGYLITGIIKSDISTHVFNISQFYWRRFLRIFPSLIFLIIIFNVVTYQLYLPSDLIDFSKTSLFALSFLSNYYFYLSDPYTANSSLNNILLHTWSLSAEWQFYLIFPILIFIINKYALKFLFSSLLVIALLSFSLAVFFTYINPDFSFYSFPTRAWELIFGGLLTFIDRELFLNKSNNKVTVETLTIVSLYILVCLFLFIDGKTLHPSFMTLLPVISTGVIIVCNNNKNLVYNVLSLNPFVYVGTISYSFYLWHQPLFSVFRVVQNKSLNLEETLLILVITLLLSSLSYFLIEKPFRRNPSKSKLMLLGSMVVGLIIYSSISLYTGGYPQRFFNHNVGDLLLHLNGNKLNIVNGQVCHDNYLQNSCGISTRKNNIPDVVLVGDSHAGSLGYSLEHLSKDKFNLIQLTSDVCLGMDTIDMYDREKIHQICKDRSKQFSKFIESGIGTVIFSARLNWYLSGHQYTNEYGYSENRLSNYQQSIRGNSLYDEILNKLNLWARNNTLILIYPEPELAEDIPRKLFNEIKTSIWLDGKNKKIHDFNFSISKSHYLARSKISYKLLDSVVGRHVIRVYPDSVLCDDSRCNVINKEHTVLYYFDDDHLSIHGADLLVNSFKDSLLDAIKRH